MKAALALAGAWAGLALLSRRDDDDRSVSAAEYIWPVPRCQRVSSLWGERPNPFPEEPNKRECHRGLDIPCTEGAPTLAAKAGRVVRADFRSESAGGLVIIAHPDGTSTRYMHLSSIIAHPGELVAQGDQIATVGSTGLSTGPHLHFEIRVDGRSVDPGPYLGAPSGTPCD